MRVLFLLVFFFSSRLVIKVQALKSAFVEYLFVISSPLLLLSLIEISIFFFLATISLPSLLSRLTHSPPVR